MSVDKEMMGRFAFDGAEDIAFHIYDTEISDDYEDPECVTEVKFGELETLVEFLRYNFPGMFARTPPADDARGLITEARLWPRDGVNEGPLINALADALEVSPRGTVADAEVEYEYTGRQHDGSPDTDRIRNYGSAQPGAPWRRRKAGEWEKNPDADSSWRGA